jgi:hypothetical protein
MTAKKTEKSAAKKAGKPAKAKTAAQQALEVAWVLKGHLKNAQIAYLRVGKLLVQVRDAKLYAALGHPDVESYAEERLHLGRTSPFKYLRVYDWVSEKHPEWLEPKPKGFIPDLSDVADLVWIETELEKKRLDKDTRAKSVGLRSVRGTGPDSSPAPRGRGREEPTPHFRLRQGFGQAKEGRFAIG